MSRASVVRVVERRRWAAAVLIAGAAALSACGATTPTPTAVATPRPTPSPSGTPQLAGTMRTVLSPLGLNVHSDPSPTSPVLGNASQGVQLTVLDYRADSGGWYKVQGRTTTGWIVADGALTAAGNFQPYSSTDRGFGVLVPDTWTFAEETVDVVFRPQSGQQSIVVRTAASSAALGAEQPNGYGFAQNSQTLVVCGYTGDLDYYSTNGATASTPTPSPSPGALPASSAQHLTDYAAIRLRFDATHTMEIAFNYQTKDQLPAFENFYNSITFPFPQCEAPATPAPAPA